MEENTNKQKYPAWLWIGINNIFKMSILPQAIYRFTEIPIKMPMSKTKRTKLKSEIVWNHKRH